MATTVEVSSAAEIGPAVQAVLDEVSQDFENADYTDFFRTTVSPFFEDIHGRYFLREEGPTGKWAELAPSTIRKKGHDMILMEKGDLERSLIEQGPNHIEIPLERGFSWGTADEKAGFHMTGTSRMPARPPVGLKDEHCDELAGLVADEVVEQIRE